MNEAPLLPAFAYIRVSTDSQAGGQSLDDQPEAIARLAATEGRAIAFPPDGDEQTGHDENRPGYQRMLALARARKFETLYVWKFDRLARDGAELLWCARLLKRLRIRLVSVVEGEFTGGPADYIRVWQGQDFSESLAKTVRPRKERAARLGQTMGKAAFGYILVPQPNASGGHYVPGKRVPDGDRSPILVTLFERAAAGWSTRALAFWMNSDPACPPPPKAASWTATVVSHILRNPVYVGKVRYNVHRTGRFETSKPEDMFIVPGKHLALIEEDLFDTVQQRLDAARNHQTRVRIARPAPLAAGLLVCVECGGPMTTSRYAAQPKTDRYLCARGGSGAGACSSTSYRCNLAHDALLEQIGRLRGRPWQPQSLDRIRESDPAAEERNRLAAELHAAESGLRRHFRRFADMIADPTPQESSAYQDVANELSDRIAQLEAEISALPPVSAGPDDLAALHRELSGVSLDRCVRELAKTADAIELRAFVLRLVDSARIVDRLPANRSRWLRVEVKWAASVRVLLDAGLLSLGPDVTRPDIPESPLEARRASQRAYYHRKRSRTMPTV